MIDNSAVDVIGIDPGVPSFQLFQRVRSHYVSDDLVITDDYGIVIGVFYMPDLEPHTHKPGWWYLILWTALPSSPWLRPPFVEQDMESNLRAV